MKKVGLIAAHYVINYGAALQCYALRKKINSFNGVCADRLNYLPVDIKRPSYKKTEMNRECLEKINKFNDFCYGAMGTNETPLTKLTPDDINGYDYFITGSGQLWNPELSIFDNRYFLDFAPDNAVKIAYAPSIGKSVELLSPADSDVFKKYLPRFDFLSVREKTHKQYLQQFTDKDVNVVIDPTLLLQAEDYNEIITPFPKDDKYIFLYFLNDHDSVMQILNFANKVSCNYGLKVKHFFEELPPQALMNKSESYKFSTGPQEFLGLLRNAEMVITNSFHATVFSVLFKKPLYSFFYKTRGSRVIDFLGALGLSDRIIEGYKPLSDISLEMDYHDAHLKLDVLREDSERFLKTALGVGV